MGNFPCITLDNLILKLFYSTRIYSKISNKKVFNRKCFKHFYSSNHIWCLILSKMLTENILNDIYIVLCENFFYGLSYIFNKIFFKNPKLRGSKVNCFSKQFIDVSLDLYAIPKIWYCV